MTRTTLLLLLLLSLQQCNNPGDGRPNAAATDEKRGAENVLQDSLQHRYLHNIAIQSQGRLSVAQAFLTDEAGMPLNAQNTVKLGEAVFLNLVIRKGWPAEDGVRSLSTSQTITTDKGESVLKTPDLLAGRHQLPGARGNRLQLKTVITETRPDIRFYVVRFRVWTKKGESELQGHYRLYLAKNKK